MSRGINGGIVVLLMIVAAVAGGLAGYFIPRGNSDASSAIDIDTTEEGRIDYACAVAADLKDAEFDGYELGDPVLADVAVIGALFNGFTPIVGPGTPVTVELGRQLYESVSRLDLEQMSETMDEIIAFCEAR